MSSPGRQLAVHLAAVLRLGARGGLDARGAERAVAWLMADLALLASHPTAPTFELGDELCVAGQPVRPPEPVARELGALARDLAVHGAVGARLRGAVDRDALTAFVRGPRTVPADYGREALQRWLDLNGGRPFELLPVRAPAADAEGPRAAPEALKTYGRLWYAVAKARAARSLPRVPPELRQAMRLLVERAQGEPRHHLALAALVDDEDPATRHAVHAAIFAVAIGQRLGLGRGALFELGLCALLAADLPADEPAALAAVAAQLARTEPDVAVARRMLATWEHRAGVDRPTAGQRGPHLYARIAALAVDYDTLVTGVAGRKGLLPDEALGRMQAQAGRRYDKALLALFAELLGQYPLGAAVLLDSDEVGVVYRAGGGSHPVVRVVVDRRGAILRGGPLLDLGAPGARRIVGTVDPGVLGIDPADALFG